MWFTSTISPPGFNTRANSSSVFSGCGHRGDDELRDHAIEGAVGEGEVGAVHHAEALHVVKFLAVHALLRLAQHRLGNIDTDHFMRLVEIGKFQAGADADVQNAAADAGRGVGRRAAPHVEQRAENDVINGRPAGIGFFDGSAVQALRRFAITGGFRLH
jgi:hypothetical protein